MTNSLPLEVSGSSVFSIPELVQLAGDGRIRIPTFQRHFTWQAKDIRSLFDSIYRGFPVGTLLLWKRDAPAGRVELGPISMNVPQSSYAYWVVDGQQRVTSLFAALSPDYRSVDDRFEIYFDFAKQIFENSRRGVVPARAIPVREALETRTLLQWLRVHSDELEPDDLDVADRLGGVLRDYRVPAYIVVGEDQVLLREVFDRVNSAGKPISRAQVFHALFANSDEPASPGVVVENLKGIGFGKIDEGRVVQSLLALRGGDVQRDIRSEFDDGSDPADWFDRVEVALRRSIGFLRGEGITHQLLMPNSLPIPVLAAFFHLHPNPEPWTRRLLARWLWRGWVHGFGREGGQTPVLRRAIRAVNPEFGNPEAAPSEFDAVRLLIEATPDRSASEIRLDGFNTKNADSRLILLALASLNPLDEDGQNIDLAAEFERYGSDAVTQLVPSHRTVASARSFWKIDSPPLSKIKDNRVLDSHLVDIEAHRLLLAGRVETFLAERGMLMQGLVRRFLDSRLEFGHKIRPPISQILMNGTSTD
ncbi:DUF262 domain-containing protein [Mycobacteroides abscessus subsp. massiliense]|nr:DUF262 domain-containing protein [Mycobacteroides abscessus subsp. massiliense]